MIVGAAELLTEVAPGSRPFYIDKVDRDESVGEPQRRFEGVGEASERVWPRDQAVDDHGNVVLDLLLKRRRFVELNDLAVDNRARVPARRELCEQVDELALLLRDDGADNLVADALRKLHELICDLLHGLALDDLAAFWTVRHTDARPEQAKVVVDLSDRSHRRAGVAVGRLLVDADRRAQPFDEVDIGTVNLPKKLASVRRERLHVASLPLGEDRVERKARLSRAREPGKNDE